MNYCQSSFKLYIPILYRRYTVIPLICIFLQEYCPPEVAPNVRVMTWLPQNDLLANDRVRLFISHGGFNSLIEAVYHAKPVIVFPILFDQPDNAAVVRAKGI